MHCTKYLRRQNATLSTSERHKKHLTTSTGIPDCRKTPENDRKPRISIVRVPTELRRPDHHEMRSEGSATLQISPDFLGILSVEALTLLVELLVSFVDVTDVSIVNMRSPPAVLGALLDLSLDIRGHLIQRGGTDLTCWRSTLYTL